MMNVTRARTLATQGLLGAALAAGLLLVPGPVSAREQISGAGQLSITLAPQADTASRSDGVDTYQVRVVNRGGGEVEDIRLTVPFQSAYRLAGASFTQDDAWVSAVGDGVATITIEQLRGVDDTVVATLSFAGPASAASNALSSSVTARWTDQNDKEQSVSSNPPTQSVVALSASASGNTVSFTGGAFASYEPVTFWYTAPSGASTPLVLHGAQLVRLPDTNNDDDDDDDEALSEFLPASDRGTVSVSFNTSGLPAGTYTLAARGNWSSSVAAATFVVR